MYPHDQVAVALPGEGLGLAPPSPIRCLLINQLTLRASRVGVGSVRKPGWRLAQQNAFTGPKWDRLPWPELVEIRIDQSGCFFMCSRTRFEIRASVSSSSWVRASMNSRRTCSTCTGAASSIAL